MQRLIERYGLRPHPEGGYYREVYRSRQTVISSALAAERQAVTHIYFLLTCGEISRFHRVVHDEIWNFYEGAPLRLVTYDGAAVTEQFLGPQESYTAIVAGGLFQAAETTGDYSLVGCSVAPGFEFADFSFMADAPEAKRTFTQNSPSYRRFL